MPKSMSSRYRARIAGVVFVTIAAVPSLARGFWVTGVSLSADRPSTAGPCPVTVTFSGHVTADGPGTVKYTFLRDDGATAPVFALEFKAAGSQPVETTWTLGDAAALPHYEGWQAVKVLSPNEMESDSSAGAFKVICDSGKDAAQQPTDGTEEILPGVTVLDRGDAVVMSVKDPEKAFLVLAFPREGRDANADRPPRLRILQGELTISAKQVSKIQLFPIGQGREWDVVGGVSLANIPCLWGLCTKPIPPPPPGQPIRPFQADILTGQVDAPW